MSNDNFSIHAWEKEKLDKLVELEELDLAREEGLAEGIERTKREKTEIAKNMLNMEMDIETISKATGLIKEKIKELKKVYLNKSNRPFFVCCVSSLCFIKPSLTKNESRELLLFS